MQFLQSILIIGLFSDLYASVAGHCDDIKYITINDPRRSTAFILTNSTKAKALCDRFVIKDNVWYRFSSEVGGEMPTTAPEFKHCGTFAPIWLNGSHPAVEDGKVKRLACLKLPHRFPVNCAESFDINIRNCSGYYIYQLKDPERCDVAYCAGSKVPNCTTADPNIVCPVNAPPYFNMPTKFYGIANWLLQIRLKAVDPEAQTLKYSVLSNGTITDISIDSDNRLLTLNVTKSGTVFVKIEDYDGNRKIRKLQIIAKKCPCKNGGNCVWKPLPDPSVSSPEYTCSCPKLYTGIFCETVTSEPFCENVPCFPGVKCTATANSYDCGHCPEKFVGDGKDCRLKTVSGTISVNAELTVDAGLVWKDDLLNKSSLYYKIITAQLTVQIKEVYVGVTEFVYVIITGYRHGSVVVEFKLILSKKMDNPLEPLRNVTKNRKLGNLTVEPIKLKNDSHVSPPMFTTIKPFRSTSLPIFTTIKPSRSISPPIFTTIKPFRSTSLLIFTTIKPSRSISPPIFTTIKPFRSKDEEIFGVRKTVFIVVMVIVSLLLITVIVVVGICIKKKNISLVMLSVSDDHAEIHPSGRNSHTSIRKSSRNQVVDIASVDNKAFIGNQYNKCWSDI